MDFPWSYIQIHQLYEKPLFSSSSPHQTAPGFSTPSKESCNCPARRWTAAFGNLSKYFIHVTASSSSGSSKYSPSSTSKVRRAPCKLHASDMKHNTNTILLRAIYFARVKKLNRRR